jgi:hypothetical protein
MPIRNGYGSTDTDIFVVQGSWASPLKKSRKILKGLFMTIRNKKNHKYMYKSTRTME